MGDFFWDGVKPPWGCLWCTMWRYNVKALSDCGQQAVVVHKCAPDKKPKRLVGGKWQEGEWAANDKYKWGTHMGLGNAQQGEVAWMKEQGIPIYSYTVDEYEELVELAKRNQRVPESRMEVQPEPEIRNAH